MTGSLRLDVVAYQVPDREGSAPARALWAWCEGMLDRGHDLTVWSWQPERPAVSPPAWCEWRPLPSEAGVRTRLRALVAPRSDARRAGWSPRPGALAVADDVPSFAAIRGVAGATVTLHHLTRLDAAATRTWTPRAVQAWRADRHAARRAQLVVAYSDRVAAHAGRPACTVPIAYPVPERPVPTIDEPVALLLADWNWRPNRRALDVLLRLWPEVKDRVPAARLVVAGRVSRELRIGTVSGVDVVGPVDRVADVLAGAAAVAFPCPPTSGPKVKVLEALAHGVPVVTTEAGIEGLTVRSGRGAIVAPMAAFAATLAGVLADPQRRLTLGRDGREDVLAGHSPAAAARAREAVFRTVRLPSAS